MENKLTRWNQKLQIAAIIVAGFWAFWTFSINFIPKMGTNFEGKLTFDVNWSQQLNTCLYSIGIALTNKSSLIQKIDEVKYHLTWQALPSLPDESHFTLVDFNPDRDEKSLLNNSRQRNSPLVGSYPPGGAADDGFDILTGPAPDKVLYVQVTLFYEEKEVGHFYEWTNFCTSPNKVNSLPTQNDARLISYVIDGSGH